MPIEDVFPIKDGDFPASYVCLPEDIFYFFSWLCQKSVSDEVCEHRWEGIGGLVNFRQAGTRRPSARNPWSLGMKKPSHVGGNNRPNLVKENLWIKKSENPINIWWNVEWIFYFRASFRLHWTWRGFVRDMVTWQLFCVRHVVDYPSPRFGLHKMVTSTMDWYWVVASCVPMSGWEQEAISWLSQASQPD